MKRVFVLGSTGSIGTQTLEVVRQNPSDFKVVALTCGSNIDILYEQILEFHPQAVSDAMIVFAPVSSDQVNAQRELENIKNGWSFKIGRVITWLPRKARELLSKL